MAAIIGCTQGLFIITRPFVNSKTLIAGAISMVLAIAGMHYIGMAAMKVAGKISYDPLILILSIFIAITVSFVAINIAIALRTPQQNKAYFWQKISASLLMGSAVLLMHYTGMAAAKFKLDPSVMIEQSNILDNDVMGFCVGLAVIGVFAMVYLVLFNSNLNRSI